MSVCCAPTIRVTAGLPAFDNRHSDNRGLVLHYYYYCLTILFLLLLIHFIKKTVYSIGLSTFIILIII